MAELEGGVDCRRGRAAAFVMWCSVAAGDLVYTRGTPPRRVSSPGVERTFCAACGTPLTYRRRDRTADVDVTACSLDDPMAVTPEDHGWTQRPLGWVRLADGLPRHATTRPPALA